MAENTSQSHSGPSAEERLPTPAADPVPEDGDSVFDEISAYSETTSLTSTILNYRRENGRTYHAYKAGSYILPNDNVTGVDLSPIQPSFVPPNVSFFVDDLEAEWTYTRPFDFIYMRAMTGSIRDWPKMFRQAYENLSPGGYIELMDPIYPVTSDDGTVPKESAVFKWSTLMNEAAHKLGTGLDSGLRYKDQLIDAGFTNVTEAPYKWPMNTWPKDLKLKELGAWGNVNLVGGVQGLSMFLFTKMLGWSTDELEVFCVDVRKDMCNKEFHGYWRVNVVYAQKPE
ncbi:hypothetical protein G7Z17_g985 [Cylindrodendrum hubeiense]|uniref:Methyltransferase domain-containing protein n=1 Tax=Cylindrodendrum hubeiense TaxID=595255 RepID=A0A9P5HNK2_9HYPO|nr:hypothetical protein G7Z17_g985 [Cylindrodendrum hubeiense]